MMLRDVWVDLENAIPGVENSGTDLSVEPINLIANELIETQSSVAKIEKNKADKDEIPKNTSDLTNDSGFVDKDYVDAAKTDVMSNIPKKVSQLENDKRYITTSESNQLYEKAMNSIQETQDTIYETLPNMFNKNDERIIPKKYIRGFKFVTASRSSVTHPIPVKEGIKYKFMTKRGYIGDAIKEVIYCDKNANFEYQEDGVTFADYQFDGTYPDEASVEFTAKKTGYVVVNMCDIAYADFVFAESDRYNPNDTRFGTILKLLVPMENLMGTPSEEVLQLLKNALGTSPLSGKKATFNGDSICAGAGFTGGYGKIITDKFGMTYQNIAVGGGTITSGNVTDSGSTRHCICDTIVNMDSDSDYAIVEGGCNDAMISAPLGAMTNGYDAELDTTTFYGAFEKMCKELVTRFAGKKIGYILTHKAGAKFNSNDTTSGYYDAALKCCAKWGVPVCNLNIEVPPLTYIPALEEAYTSNADGTHPNEAGYNAYYVPKIIAFMERL